MSEWKLSIYIYISASDGQGNVNSGCYGEGLLLSLFLFILFGYVLRTKFEVVFDAC